MGGLKERKREKERGKRKKEKERRNEKRERKKERKGKRKKREKKEKSSCGYIAIFLLFSQCLEKDISFIAAKTAKRKNNVAKKDK